ncbi:hypothetical protein GH714_012500 [Hevea brasiliensis]|uniref:Sister chromatid cohesion protein n=1 Tax=Hevea brasiliensis TaxID=3981 RepID=A0A6A6MNU9_HEVBR|nr:hypothetical protein GH714_012500 [Hevea brasiliensis]
MSYSNSYATGSASGWTSGSVPRGIGLSNTIHSEVAPCLPLPSLPVFCGASDPHFRLFDETGGTSVRGVLSFNRSEILSQSARIADLLRETDVSYLNLRDETRPIPFELVEPSELHDLVLQCNPEAFDFLDKKQISGSTVFESKPIGPSIPLPSQGQRDYGATQNQQFNSIPNDIGSSTRKLKAKKKGTDDVPLLVQPDPAELQDAAIGSFCDMLEEFCGRAEIMSDERDDAEWLSVPVSDVRMLVNEIMSICSKKLLHLVPVDILVRLLRVLDHQIHRAEGLSVDECEHDSDAVSLVFCALESIHAALAVMAHNNMPKQLYKEENIERILEFSKHQIMDVMSGYDPSYRALHKPSENGPPEGDEDEELETEYGSASKRRRTQKSTKLKKSTLNKVSGAVNAILQKLCTVLGLLKDLLLIERLSDSCILQLLKTSFTTFLVDNIQLLQLKAIGLIGGIFYSYALHRTYVIDEVVQLLWKLPFSKRVLRAYHLPDEERRQIQIITALLIQLVHSSANLPDPLREASSGNSILEVSLDASYPTKCHEAVTETCCLFWTRVLQRFTTVKNQDASELKVMVENIVTDLLTTLNLPEYPASAPILEVLCVLLLQNAGLKSKDISSRSLAIDLLGTVAARLKQDAVICCRNKFWILMELTDGDNVDQSYPKDACCVCLAGIVEKTVFMCQAAALNHLQDSVSADDVHLFVRWFYLCLWYKDDPKSQQKLIYYLTRLKSNLVVRDTVTNHSKLKRDSAKKITLALGQISSFCRGFDKILHVLLASLRENSPVIRAKSLRAVSIIVEVDPEVLCDKRVQMAVEGRFCDSAISVREAALELVGRHIASHPDVGLKYFEKVAERIKDTGDLVCKTFYEFWFEEPSGLLTQYFGDGSSVPLEVAKKTEQIVEMLRKMPSHQLLVTVIKRNLALDFFPQSAKAAGINPVSVASVRKRCELMCKCLLEKILQVEEMSSKEMEVSTLPYVLALHAFCVVDATLCAPASDPSQFVVTLQPYLKTQVLGSFHCDDICLSGSLEFTHRKLLNKGSLFGANGKSLRIVTTNMLTTEQLHIYWRVIIFIIDSVLPLIRKLPQSVVEELEQDLMHMIVRHSFLTVVHACIKCLCSLSRVAGKGAAVVEYLIQVFFKRLDALGTDNKQTQALQNMYEYLLDSESQMGADKVSNDVNHYPVEGGHSVPVAAGAGDTNICGGIVQLFWDNILGRCLDFSEQVRQTALKIVEIVLRQGLVHPITCVPYLIALETDPQELNSKLAHHLLMNMNEKYPAFFESRLGDGLQLSFIFMQSCSVSPENLNQKLQSRAAGNLKGKPEGGSLVQARIGVSRIYKLIRGNRVSRNKFMSSIVRKFDNPTWTNSVIPFFDVSSLFSASPRFLISPFVMLFTEVGFSLQVRAGALEANMKGLILHLSQRNSRKLPHENGVIQQEPAQPVLYHMPTMNLNGMMQQDLVVQPDLTPLTSLI